MRAAGWTTRAQFRAADGVLLVQRDPPPPAPATPGQPPIVASDPAEGPEILLALADDGGVVALAGHVDLGTGIATAYAQIVAEELDLPMSRVAVVLGDTARVPNQGPTIASTSIQVHAQPLRCAAAQARAWLVAQAAAAWAVEAATLTTREGVVESSAGHRTDYAALVAGRHVELTLDAGTPLKSPAEFRIVGTSVPRSDIPAKVAGGAAGGGVGGGVVGAAAGAAVYVHDVRLPGMKHGRVVRPPYAGIDAGDFVGRTLQRVDEASIAHLPGVLKTVVIGDFIGIVAEREEQADDAMHALRIEWKPWPALPPLADLAQALRDNPATPRVVAQHGDVDRARAAAAQLIDRDYVWPYQLHASIGPSCAVASWQQDEAGADRLTVWAGTQNPFVLRADLARLTGLPARAIEIIRLEASGCYGRNGADDVAADAVLLSRAVGAPVRVQLTREQEHAWEPKGAAQLMQVRGGLNADGSPAAYDFTTSYPSNAAPTLALLLTRTIEPVAQAFEMGDRTAVPPYDYPHLRVTVNDMPPILRASWLRGVSALPNSFAHESWIDELASAAGVDPVEYRLRHLNDERAAELVRATAARAGWKPHTRPQQQMPGPEDEWLQGQGFAYARYVHSKFPGFGAAWAAWVADVDVHRQTGEVQVRRIVVGHDAGMMVNPAGVLHQVHGNVLQTTSRALKEQVSVDPTTGAVNTREWGSYPILGFREVPVVEVMLMPRPGEAPLGVGESASVPGTAAIANAIFDATGLRFRQPPFTPEVVRAAINPLPSPSPSQLPSPLPASTATATKSPEVQAATSDPQRGRKPLWAIAGALLSGALTVFGAMLGWRPTIAPVAVQSAGVYSAELIERGRQLAALGNCEHCHTAEGGVPLAGGRALATPFGTIVSTNITPDPATGIGGWSFSAFQRALREGIARDGRHLYPAFPYTAFTQVPDDDLQALYAWLMTRPAVTHVPPPTSLRFPFDQRPLMALWNAIYLQPGPVAVVPARSAVWQRGAALVNGLGHCGACHTPRDAFGGERRDTAYLKGALVDGWEAPALGAASRRPWTEAQLLSYLRQGHDREHGIAGGSMAAVVRGLAQLPEDDVRSMAHYLVSLQAGPDTEANHAVSSRTLLARSQEQARTLRGPAQRLFEQACGACHHDGDGPPVLGLNHPLALNGNLHSARPDNLIRTLLDGIRDPAFVEIGHMPAFRDAFDDAQVADLVGYLRQRFAPDEPAWADLSGAVARARSTTPRN